MAIGPWQAGNEVADLLNHVKESYHSPRLAEAEIGVCFDDSKPFKKGKFNWGKVVKFAPVAKLYQEKKLDFALIIPADVWHEVLSGKQREAYLDMLLTRCQAEYLPVTIEENGRKKPVKDKWGRTEYSDEIKLDEEGNPVWKTVSMDACILADNVKRFGPWFEDLEKVEEALDKWHEECDAKDYAESTTGGRSFFGGGLVPGSDVVFCPNYGPDDPEYVGSAKESG